MDLMKRMESDCMAFAKAGQMDRARSAQIKLEEYRADLLRKKLASTEKFIAHLLAVEAGTAYPHPQLDDH